MSDRDLYMPGLAYGAEVRRDGDAWTLVLVREMKCSPEKVWQALTEPAYLYEWAPFDADGSLNVAGAKVNLATVGAPASQVSETVVTRAEAPGLLAYNWGGQALKWELEGLDMGTRLTLEHAIDRRFITWVLPVGISASMCLRGWLRTGRLGGLLVPKR